MTENIDNTNWGVIITTIALVAITAYYAWQTRKTVNVLKESNKILFIPSIHLKFKEPNKDFHQIFLINIGKGAAIDLQCKIEVIETNYVKEYKNPVFSPEDVESFDMFDFPSYDKRAVDYYIKNQITVKFDWKCKDILNNPYESSIVIDITSLAKTKKK